MKNHTLISVLQATKGVQTVKVKFSKNGEAYTYKTLLDLEPGQFVVVECRDAYSIAKVIKMDETPDVLDESFELKWVVHPVDTARIDEIREEERRLSKQLALSEAKKRMHEMVGELNIEMPALRLEVLDA